MSFLAPIWLGVAAAVGVGILVAHLFSTSVPPRDYLPTVRFVPEGAPMAVMRTRRLSDVPLLLLRLLAVALFGLALAGVHLTRNGPSAIVLVDASRAVRSFGEVRDSARAAAAEDAMLIAFDASARRVSRDSLETMDATDARGSLSAALVVAHRAMAPVSEGRERTELIVVSPLVREEVDSASARLLALWSGPVRHVRVAAADPPTVNGVTVRATGDDPVAAAVSRAPKVQSPEHRAARIVRTLPTRADTAWARDSGNVLVLWPADERSDLLARRATVDTQTAVAAGSHVVVATFARAHQPRGGRVLARWIDGEPAATETPLGRGCIREVAIPVDPVGDVVLRENFRAIAGRIIEPCGGSRDFTASVMPSKATAARSDNVQVLRRTDNRLPWLLAAFALAVLLLEQFLRARIRTAI